MCAVIILLGVLGFLASQFMSSENGGKLIDKIDTSSMGASGMGMDMGSFKGGMYEISEISGLSSLM